MREQSLQRGDPLVAESSDGIAYGAFHAVQEGRLFVQLRRPFGEVAAGREFTNPSVELSFAKRLLVDLLAVCTWAEANADALSGRDAVLRAQASSSTGGLDADELGVALRQLEATSSDPAVSAEESELCDRYEAWCRWLDDALERALPELGCPHVDVAISAWDDLRANGFYREDRRSLGD
jgi:hypothetical protein